MSIWSNLSAAFMKDEERKDPAEEFWGDFTKEGNIKPDLLVLSIYEYCRAVSVPVPMVDGTQAKAYLNPQGFQLACFMLGVTDVIVPVEEQKFMNLDALFNMHRKYYSVFGLEPNEVLDPMLGKKIPLISRKSLGVWIGYRIMLYPDKTHQALNKAFKNFKLLHPFDETPFEHPNIPRSSFPATGNDVVPDSAAVRAMIAENWPKAKAEIIAAARQTGPSAPPGGMAAQAQAMMNSAANNVINSQIMAANNVSTMAASQAGAWGAAQGSLGVHSGFATQSAGIW